MKAHVFRSRPGFLKLALFGAVVAGTFFAALAATPEPLRALWTRSFSTNPYARIELSLSPDGRELRGDYYEYFHAWRVGDGTELGSRTNIPVLYPTPSFTLTSIARTDDNLLLAGYRFPQAYPRLLLWDGHSPDVVAAWERADESDTLSGVAYHPATGRIATASDYPGRSSLRLHDPVNLVPTNQIALRGEARAVRFSAAGQFVLSWGSLDGGVIVWQPAPPSRVFGLYPPDEYFQTNQPLGRIDSVAVSTGNLVAYGGVHGGADGAFYDQPGVIFVHRLPGGEVVRALQGHGHPVGPVAFVGEGDVLMSTDGETLRFWHMTDGRQLLVLPGLPVGFQGGVWLGSPLVAPDTTWFAIHGPQQGQVTVYRMPLLLTHSSIVGEQLEVRWVGGSGRYQVQRSPSPDGAWENTGEVFSERVATLPTTPERGFFRVMSVGE